MAPDLALKELERAAKLPGMRALYLATTIAGSFTTVNGKISAS